MRNKFMITAIAIVVALDAIARALPSEGGASSPRSAWESENGTVDISGLQDAENVMDSAGAFVGVVKTSDDMAGIYPLPVYDRDDDIVGYVGENGFWALGETPPLADEGSHN